MHALLLLAQDSEKGVALIERILAGGVPLICLVIAAICGYAFYKTLVKNNTLETGFREKVEALLREMLDRDKESQEAVSAAVQAVEAFQAALAASQREVAEMARKLEELGRKVERLDDAVRARPPSPGPGV